MSSKNRYFATEESSKIGAELEKREKNWFDFLKDKGHYSTIKRCYRAYYGENAATKNGKIANVGEHGNLKALVFNEYRNFLQHILSLTTQTKLNFQPRAVNTDHKSMAQAIVAKSVLDTYSREKGLQSVINEAAEYAIATTEGFTKIDWNTDMGDRVFEDKMSGDIEYRVFPGFNVIRDPKKTSQRKQQWFILREKQNKFDLAAKYPELAEQILAIGNKDDDNFEHQNIVDELMDNEDYDDDDIFVKEFWHERTPTMPDGRMVIYLSADVVLYDGPLPYEKSHLYRMTPSDRLGTTLGYSVAIDMLPLQEILDALVSTVTTNMTNFGGQNILVKNGDGFSLEQFGALNILKYNEAKPEALSLESTPATVTNFINQVRQFLETMTNIGGVVRGQVPDGVTAGSALALLQAQSIQFNSGLQRNYATHGEDVSTGTIDLLKQFGTSKRAVYVIGENNRGYMKSFSADDIAGVSRVVVEVTNPLEATYAGRKQMSDEWLEKGVITPKQQLLFIRTGNLEQATDRDEKEMMLMKLENEKLSKGELVQVLDTDLHIDHILEHKGVLSDPDVRANPDITQATLKHIHEHLTALATVNPDLLQMLGQPVLGMGQPVPPQGGPAPEEIPFTGEQTPEEVANPQGELPKPAEPPQGAVGQPNNPTIPS